MEIVDNFLSNYYCDQLSSCLIKDSYSDPFPWYFADDLNGTNKIGNYYFNHTVVTDFKPVSRYFPLFYSLISRLSLNSQQIMRLKVNLYPRTQRRVHHESHIDYESNSGLRTCLYYLNDNDGVTIFDGKNRIKSKRNRAVLFDGSIKHHSTTPTNVNYRCTINIEYTQ